MASEPLLQLRDDAVEIRVFAVHLGNVDDARQVAPVGEAPHLGGSDFDARLRRDDYRRRVRHADAGDDFAAVVGVAGGVDEVYLRPVPGDVHHGGAHAGVALLLFRLEIRHRRAVLDPSEPVRDLRRVEHRFGENGLSRSTMRQ